MRVVIADDSGLLRDGLAGLLVAAGIEVAACAADADELIAAVEMHAPDLAIIDIRMPPTYTHEGARAAVALRSSHPQLGIPSGSATSSRTASSTSTYSSRRSTRSRAAAPSWTLRWSPT
jgi:DNA-binding NarL/FixJ family response regulator